MATGAGPGAVAFTLAIGVTLVATMVFGFFPGLVGHFGDVATDLASAVGR